MEWFLLQSIRKETRIGFSLVDFLFLLNFIQIFLLCIFPLMIYPYILPLIKLFTDNKSIVKRNFKISYIVTNISMLFIIYFDRLTILIHLDNKSVSF